VEYIESGTVERPNGESYDVVCVVVEELAKGGEIFFFVANTGFFTEIHTRFFMD
jgi:hypothetical protein